MESESRDHLHQAKVYAGTHQSDYIFKEEDLPGLAEALAEVAHKWEEIAVALRLSEAVRAECREGSSLAMKLYRVLYQWVVGQHSNAAQATRENLKKALTSPLVQHPQLASELVDRLKTLLTIQTLIPSQSNSIFQNAVREVLVEKYSQCPEVPQGFWPPIVSKTFINLALIDTSGQPLKSDYSIRGDADDVLAQKKRIEYEDIFCIYKKRKKILILGRPGSGKTTLVHKLVRDWSAGKALQEAELVFLVSLRMLDSENDRKLSDILQPFFYDENFLKQTSRAVEEVQGERVCFIFDGFDEYFFPNKRKSVVFALLEKSYLVNAMIIVTSRPAAASVCVEVFDHSFKKIEVFGFCNSQIKEYIDCFPFSSSYGTEDHSIKLQRFLEAHPGVLDLCYLPVNCAIICFIYDTEPDHLPETQTQIYALFTRLIIIRQLTMRDISRQLDSLEDLEGQEAEDFKKLCHLAFEMTIQSHQVITRGPASSDEAHSLGLVTTDITAGLCGYKNSYSFLHLTLQEFLAAYHLSKLDNNQQLSHIEKHAVCPFLLNMWKLYFGLTNFKMELCNVKKALALIMLKQTTTPSLFKIQCAYEAQQTNICQLASSHTLSFHSVILSKYDMSAIAYTMSKTATQGNSATPTTQLIFQSWGPGNDKLKTLLSQLNDAALGCLEYLDISHFQITITDMKALADKLSIHYGKAQGGLKSLRELRLTKSGIGDESVAVLAAGLNGNNVLEELILSSCVISAKGISEIMKSDCRLRSLVLKNIGIDDEGARAVARGLRGNLVINSVHLVENKIGIDGIEALSLALLENTYNFHFLKSLHDRNTSDSFSSDLIEVESIMECLRFENSEEKLILKCSIKNGNTKNPVHQDPLYCTSIKIAQRNIDKAQVKSVIQSINKSRSMSWSCFQNNYVWMKKIEELLALRDDR